MKRGELKTYFIVSILFLSLISYAAADCTLIPVMINQDPNPAVPGETVKVLFQLQGVENPDCGKVTFELIEEYPFTIDPSSQKKVEVQAGTFQTNYNSYLMVPYKIRINKDALTGDAKIRVKYASELGIKQVSYIKNFTVDIQDVLADFVVTVDSYSYATKKLVLGIINTGENNIQAATVEIPTQDTIDLQGSHVKILGDLDSNEDTTISFDALPKEGNIKVIISYNDETNQRRTVEKNILFTEISFDGTKQTNNKFSTSAIFLFLTWIGIIFYIWYSRKKRRKMLDKQKFLRR